MASITTTTPNSSSSSPPFSKLSHFFNKKSLHHCLALPLQTPPPLSPPKPKSINLTLSPSPLTPPLHRPDSITHQQFDSFHDQNAPPHRLRHLLHLSVHHHDLALGRAVHAFIIKTHQPEEEGEDTHLINILISMYLKLGRLSDARKTFASLLFPDVVSYSSMISAYAKCDQEREAFGLFCRMRRSGVEPNEFSFVAILTNCIRQSNSLLGFQLHALVIKTHHCCCVYVSNALMGFYGKCERFDAVVQLFDEMPSRDVSSWNAVISAMVKDCKYDQAFELFRDMQMDGICGDQFSLSSLLTAAAEGSDRVGGEAVHAYALKIGLELDLSVGNALVGFYTQFGSVEDLVDVFQRMPVRDVISWTGLLTGYMEFGWVESAVKVFDQMPERNCVSYNALLTGFCHNGEGYRALQLFQEILEDGVAILDCTLTSVVNACALVSEVKQSEQIHAFVIKVGCGPNARIEVALLDMCAKCCRMEDAQRMFDGWIHDECWSIAWTSLICSYARNGQPDEAMSLFHAMQKREAEVIMDEIALATILGVCGTLGFGDMGKQIHCSILKSGVLSDLAVGNAVFSMYAKCGNREDAIRFFNLMPRHDTVSWNTMITAHLLHREGDEAWAVWVQMEKLGVKPDPITFVLILSACRYTNANSVDTCRRLFLSMASSYSIEPASEHYAALVDVLGYWGYFDDAEKLIRSMPFKPDASVWRALLDSCRLHSNLSLGRQAVQHLLALEPQDPSTYVLVSNLYSASGRWHCSEKVREEMRRKGLHKHPVRSWIIHQSAIHSFYARDISHPRSKDIHGGLKVLIMECMKGSYEPDTSFVLHEVEEYQKKDFLFYHSAKLAVTYGLLMTQPGSLVRVVKNIRLCGDCHTFLKCVSSVTGRVISLRDSTGFHCFEGGVCSCKDNW